MASSFVLNLLFLSGLFITGIILTARSRKRTAHDVIRDLSSSPHDDDGTDALDRAKAGLISTDAAKLGIFDEGEYQHFLFMQKLFPIAFAMLFVLLRAALAPATVKGHIIACIVGFSLGYLVRERRVRSRQERHVRSLEYFLPIVMERLVMAVEAGLDVTSGLLALDELVKEEALHSGSKNSYDGVTRLLSRALKLADAGLSFEEALRQVAETADCSALRHAFIHLALAYREGGELVGPLRELSDSTQLFFQETVEEEIAKLPVKATLPLLCTFAGLIIFFITSPLIEVIDITQRAMPK